MKRKPLQTAARAKKLSRKPKKVARKSIKAVRREAVDNFYTALAQETAKSKDAAKRVVVDDIGEGLAWVSMADDNPPRTEEALGANPKQAYGDAKVALQLVPPVVGILAAVAFKEGAIKYGAFNYRETKVEMMTYIGAIQRHCAALLDGEDIDPDSILGKSHLSGIIASAGIIADCQENGNLIDNRPKKGTGTALLKKWERTVG